MDINCRDNKMKIYFCENQPPFIAQFANVDQEPVCLAKFDIQPSMSKFANRYALEEGLLVDKYLGKTDEEVASILQQKQKELADQLAAALAKNANT